MRLALRAQSQCRATLETLAVITNPPMVFAKQANFTGGPQQVNNGVSPRGEIQNQQNRLLEQTNGERLDLETQGPAIGTDTPLATVDPVDRAKNG